MTTDTEWSKNSSGEHPLLGAAARAFEQAKRVSIHKERIGALAENLAAKPGRSHWLNCAPDAVRSFLAACAPQEKNTLHYRLPYHRLLLLAAAAVRLRTLPPLLPAHHL